MPPTRGSIRRHIPTIATFSVIAWLAAVCLYAIGDAPASARRAGPERLIEEVLGGRPSPPRFETRTRPVTVDVRATQAAAAESEQKKDKKETDEKAKKPAGRKPQHRRDERARRKKLGHTLPVAPRLVTERDLKAPHHDYPAVDLPLDSGTRVVAVTAGRVEATTKWGGCGKGVILKGRDNFTYTFCHGSKLLVGRGRQVKAGQGIMRSGNTGDSTGPHLHLQIRKPNGKLVCPQDLLPRWNEGEPTPPWEAKRVGCKSDVSKKPRKGGKR